MTPKIKFTIITLFQDALRPYLDSSMLYKAQERGIIEIDYVNLRDFGIGAHKSVDDTPYGGGDGMLLRCEPVFAAIESVKKHDPEAKVILPTPVGQTWNQALARKFAGIDGENVDFDSFGSEKTSKCSETSVEALEAAIMQKCGDKAVMTKNASEGEFEASNAISADFKAENSDFCEQNNCSNFSVCEQNQPEKADFCKHYIILCPHYEGYDERIMSIVDYPISLGNYVLTGGELPALIIIDSVTRLLPGVLGGATSAEIESFSDGNNLEFPQYTKPAEFRGMKVPEILLSGDHGKVAEWRIAHIRRQK